MMVKPFSLPKFDEQHYLDSNSGARHALESGSAESAFEHFVENGIDENRYPLIRREPAALQSSVERFVVSHSGFCLLVGWLADEGSDPPRYKLLVGEFNVELPETLMFRHARSDVENHVKGGAFDYGFVMFGQSPSKSLLKQSLLFQINAMTGTSQVKITPEIVSDKRLMDILLQIIATCEVHAGKETTLNSFLSGEAGETLIKLFQLNVASATASPYVERFRPRAVSCSFVTVLFGSTEPINLQPLLFNAAKVDFGEWIYVCNSPEDAGTVLRYARLISDLYDVMITVIVLGDNAGFGAANNVAIEHAASERIFIINPDVHVMPAYANALQQVLAEDDLGTTLWGGLLFYDDQNLMHSGMYLECDTFIRRNALNRNDVSAAHCRLLRVEHFDKGVPFEPREWTKPKEVPAITGAVMAFNKAGYEKLGGFSTRYVYGHYEDADLSLRWHDAIGSVAVHPHLRLVHLEGQGSTARGEEFRGASMANRHFFTAKHGDYFAWNRDKLGKSPEATAAILRISATQ
jgi:GT2 family glycosyltransferase